MYFTANNRKNWGWEVSVSASIGDFSDIGIGKKSADTLLIPIAKTLVSLTLELVGLWM